MRSPVANDEQLSRRGRTAPRLVPRISAAPKVRQMYWCDFWEDACLPEMCKTRPVVILSFKNTLHGHCLVVPTSTDPQEGQSAKWAHPLSFAPDGRRASWVVCNHLYTVSTARLAPLSGTHIPRLSEDEFNAILTLVHQWLPSLPG
jgi:mRNA interferase MazF